MNSTTIHPFIASLEALAEKHDRGALAALRRGLGQDPGTAAEMYRYVEPYLPEKRSAALEAASYLVAALFAYHPQSARQGNLGAHLAATRGDNNDALERRFTALLAAHPDDLPAYLRQAISYLKSKDQPVNWNQLFYDLQLWGSENRRIQKQWAAAFWGSAPAPKPETAPADDGTVE